jgi:hypothetical protein
MAYRVFLCNLMMIIVLGRFWSQNFTARTILIQLRATP